MGALTPFFERIIKQLISYIDKQEMWGVALIVFFISILVYVILFFVGSYYGKKKTMSEIERNSEESKKIKIENTEKLHEKELAFEKAQETQNLHIYALIQSMDTNKSVDEVRNYREELINFLSTEYLGTFERFLDLFEIVKGKKERQYFFKTYVFDLLDTLVDLTNTVNSKSILDVVNDSTLVFSEATFRRIELFYVSHFKWYNVVVNIKYKKIKKKMIT